MSKLERTSSLSRLYLEVRRGESNGACIYVSGTIQKAWRQDLEDDWTNYNKGLLIRDIVALRNSSSIIPVTGMVELGTCSTERPFQMIRPLCTVNLQEFASIGVITSASAATNNSPGDSGMPTTAPIATSNSPGARDLPSPSSIAPGNPPGGGSVHRQLSLPQTTRQD